MVQQLGLLKETPSQTAGPYVHIGLHAEFRGITGVYDADLGNAMVNDKTPASASPFRAASSTAPARPLRDALVEIWQADANGLYNSPAEMRGTADPNFTGWGRCPTDAETGVYSFETIKPGRAPFKDGRLMAPHITFWIVARGINIGLAYAHVFCRRRQGQCRGSAAGPHRAPASPGDPDRRARWKRLYLRHPSAGRAGNRVPGYLRRWMSMYLAGYLSCGA